MTETSIGTLVWMAGGVAVGHVLLGPDHYLPFLAMAKIRRWSAGRTLGVTLACGVGHVVSSFALGMVALAFGWAAESMQWWNDLRGDLAAWLLISLGLMLFVVGVRRAIRKGPHSHWHSHADGTVHSHALDHAGEHLHVHSVELAPSRLMPWVLFTIFLFGPCEPLIPLVLFAAAAHGSGAVVLTTAVFALSTLVTMSTVVYLGTLGLRWTPLGLAPRFGHALAGLVIALCGVAVQLGL